MSVQFIEHNGQHEYAVIPVEQYNSLLEKAEMLDDIRAFDKAILSDEESIPGDIVSRLISGENKLKVWRTYRGLTQAELGKQSGLAQGTIAQIEGGTRKGSVNVLMKIANILRLDIDDLIDD